MKAVLFDIDGTLTHSDPLHFAMCVTLDHPGTSSWQLLNVPGCGRRSLFEAMAKGDSVHSDSRNCCSSTGRRLTGLSSSRTFPVGECSASLLARETLTWSIAEPRTALPPCSENQSIFSGLFPHWSTERIREVSDGQEERKERKKGKEEGGRGR